MNKKFALSKVTIVMLILLVAVVVYVFAYFTPAQSTAAMLRSEPALHNAEAAIYQAYLADPSPLEADIQALQQQIDELKVGHVGAPFVWFQCQLQDQRCHPEIQDLPVRCFSGVCHYLQGAPGPAHYSEHLR